MTLTIKLDGNWSSFQLANSTPPLSVTDSAIAPSARIGRGVLFECLSQKFLEKVFQELADEKAMGKYFSRMLSITATAFASSQL